MIKLIQRYSHCFVCGDKNELGLKIDFFYEDGKAKAEFSPSSNYEGYKDILHGGIISTLLDEVMIKSILEKGFTTVTSQIEVRFRRPAKIGEKLLLEGWITKDKGKIILAEGKISTQEGAVISEAKGKYFKVSAQLAEQLNKGLD